MSEDIKIEIKTEYDDAGLKKAQADVDKLAQAATKVKIQNLYQAAAAYEDKGMFEAAKSARAEAKGLEKDLTRESKERAAEEKKVTEEHKKQEVLAKARQGYLQRVGHAGKNLLQSMTGRSALGDFVGAVVGGPAGLVASAVTTALGFVAKSIVQHVENVAVRGAEDQGARAVTARQMMRQRGVDGTAGSNRELAEGFGDQAVAAEAAKKVEEKKRGYAIFHPTQWLGMLTGEANEGIAAKEDERKRAADNMTQARVQAAARYKAEIAPLIEAQNKLNQGDARGARVIQDKMAWQSEYNRLKKLGATEEERVAGADTAFATTQRERAGKFASLVTARDGAGDIARIAGLAREQMGGGRTADQLKAIHETMGVHHFEAIAAATSRKFHEEHK